MGSAGEAWIDSYTAYLVEKYFGKCGLVEDALKELRNLPRGLARRLGREESFWRQYLSRDDAATRRLNLLWGAVEKVGKQALANERKHSIPFCKYLERALDQEEMTNWISSLLRAFREVL
jgi:homogentisate 1,2-dioxygenase